LAVMQSVARDLNTAKASLNGARVAAAAATLRAMGSTLGLLQQDPEHYLKRSAVGSASAGLSDAEIEAELAARRAARAAKKFKESDRIRDRLRDHGVILEDKPGGITEWRRS